MDSLNGAYEISLDEYITREAMHPADQVEAFRRWAEDMLGHDGLACFERGLVRAEDAALTPPPPWEDYEGADG